MKSILAAFIVLSASSGYSMIQNSQLEARHQSAIKLAISQACGYFRNITEVKTSVRKQRVDQGIVDYYFTSVFELTFRIDNGVFDQYQAYVESSLHSGYDHQSGNWGLYRVDSVSCRKL